MIGDNWGLVEDVLSLDAKDNSVDSNSDGFNDRGQQFDLGGNNEMSPKKLNTFSEGIGRFRD